MTREILNRMYENGERHIANYGDVECASHAWIAEHKDTHTFDDYMALMRENTDWGPSVCAQMFTLGHKYHEGDALFALHDTYAEILCAYPFEHARRHIEHVMDYMHRKNMPISPAAREMLEARIYEAHPAAGQFLERFHKT